MSKLNKRVTTAVYLIKDDQVLFLIRDKKNDLIHKKGVYLGLGGHIELGESIEDAARREVMEESGIVVNALQFHGVCHFRGFNQEADITMFVFSSDDFTGKEVAGPEGNLAWVPKKELFNLPIYAGDKIFLKYMLENKYFVIDFLFNGDTLVEHDVLTLIDNQ